MTSLTSAQDNVPKLINYQGKLTNVSGQAMADGTYKLRFGIYNKKDSAQPGDSLVWGMDYGIILVGGQFNVVLGADGGTPVAGAAVNDIGFAFTGAERYVQLTVLTDNTGANLTAPQVLLPRQQLLSVPYALNAPGVVPIGGIIMWWGDSSNIPVNFEICDGGTPAAGSVLTGLKPDLRGRFARGAPQGTSDVSNPAVSGGVDSLNLAHNHPAGSYTALLVGPSVAGGQSIYYQQKATQAWWPSNYMYVPGDPLIVDETTNSGPYGVGAAIGGQSASALGVVDNRPAFSQVFYIIRVK